MNTSMIFVYGILKRGFNADLTKYGGKFIGEAELERAKLYSIGHGVGLRFTEHDKDIVFGELFEIPDGLWEWLDEIEYNGVTYTRKRVFVESLDSDYLADGYVSAWVYEHTYPGMKYDKPIEGGIFK